jgi:hypothetical protein
MTFILRWPAILVLLALMLLSLIGALGAGALITGYEAPIAQVQSAQADAAESGAADATWIDVGLLVGAGVFFLISSIRLMRRTQGFWSWLIGFALYGGRWAWEQQNEGGLLATVQGIDPNAYAQPQVVASDLASPEAQVALLVIVLVVGVIIFIVDAADRSYWDKQGA